MVNTTMLRMAHGIMMVLSFAFFMTIGSGLLRALKVRSTVWVHAGFLSVAYVLMLAAFGLGVYLADKYNKLDSTHAVIGFICVGALLLQPLGGFLAHARYTKVGRNIFGLIHRWIGRIFVTLAIINGGLGIELTGSSRQWVVSYSIVAAVTVAFWWSASLIDWAMNRRHNNAKAAAAEPKESFEEPLTSAHARNTV